MKYRDTFFPMALMLFSIISIAADATGTDVSADTRRFSFQEIA